MKLCQTTLKSNNFEEFKLKKDYGIQKIAHAGYAKGSYQRLFLYNMPVNFYAEYFTNYVSHFSIVFESILNNSCLLL